MVRAGATKLLEVATPGCVDYDRAVAWQERLVARRLAGGPDALLLLEHPPVYTLGRSADARHLGRAGAGDVPVRRVARGGQATYHGPGQLVGYPVVALAAQGRDVHRYLRALEEVLIATIGAFGIAAERRPGFTGVWVRGCKIASIGIAVRRWVAWHGFALNVGRDLGGFASITPCGIPGVQMTSIVREGGPGDVAGTIPVLVARFIEIFGYAGVRPLAFESDALVPAAP
ncbi:MAG: lipoyl(octanoyl) transferase LipB [Deltaproteobacteria bacterium]|nr:MAG: lipoyl(octanoyl) transferase LipB [Deltaproteobacteria bacterium]